MTIKKKTKSFSENLVAIPKEKRIKTATLWNRQQFSSQIDKPKRKKS